MNQAATLYYLVGPSGVGKDSLLNALRAHPDARHLHVAERCITRPTRRGDDQHVELDAAEFARREQRGEFLFSWSAHGFDYGVPREVLQRLQAGEDVVVNGSRAYLANALGILPGLVPVWMRVSEVVLSQRLGGRARESAAQIERRLERNRKLERGRDPAWPVIENDADIAQTCRRFLELRARHRQGP